MRLEERRRSSNAHASAFLREAQIWYSRDPGQYPVSDQFENVIVLSDEFYREIVAHPIPADLEAVKVLAGAPAALDLFMWLSYRCFGFREKLEEWLKSVRLLVARVPRKDHR
jgi:hypothetical protein